MPETYLMSISDTRHVQPCVQSNRKREKSVVRKGDITEMTQINCTRHDIVRSRDYYGLGTRIKINRKHKAKKAFSGHLLFNF